MENTTIQLKELLQTEIGLIQKSLEYENPKLSDECTEYWKGYKMGLKNVILQIDNINTPLSLYQKVNEVERLNLLINSESEMIDDLEREIDGLENDRNEYENECDNESEDYDTDMVDDWNESIQIKKQEISRCESEIERYEYSLRLLLK